MTINTVPAKDWPAHNGGHDDPRYNSCSPNLLAIKAEMQHLWGVADLGCYGERDIRGGGVPSAHSHGAAVDLRYLEQIGRTRFLNEVIPWLIANSDELHIGAIHDYLGGRIWHAGRTPNVADAYTAWWKAQPPSTSTGMGQPWGGWVHLETTEAGWHDSTPVVQRLISHTPTVPTPPILEEDDMLPIITNAEVFQNVPALMSKWALMDDGRLRHLDPVEWETRGSKDGTAWLNDSLVRHGADLA